MITKGIITTINYTTNSCTVRIPRLEPAGNKVRMIMPAVFSTLPGVYNGYKVDDVVWVAFEVDNISEPVIIGKLFLGTTEEIEVAGGTGRFQDAVITNSLSIPLNTKFVDPENQEIKNNEVEPTTYESIQDLITVVNTNSLNIKSLNPNAREFISAELQVGSWINNEPLYQIVRTYNHSTTSIILPNLSDINNMYRDYDKVWIDSSHSFYYTTNAQTMANISNWTIDLSTPNNQTITVPQTATNTTGVVTILYTTKYNNPDAE